MLYAFLNLYSRKTEFETLCIFALLPTSSSKNEKTALVFLYHDKERVSKKLFGCLITLVLLFFTVSRYRLSLHPLHSP